MIPERVIAGIKEVAACQSARDVLDHVEHQLYALKHDEAGANISRAAKGSVVILDHEPQSSRAGPGALAILVKMPTMLEPGALQRTLHVHDDRVGGRGIAKATIIATLLDWLGNLSSRHTIATLRLVFYEWQAGNMPLLDQFASVLPVDHALAWFAEPTGLMTCPAEKGFGRLAVSFVPPSHGAGPVNIALGKAISKHFTTPSHPVYPLDPGNRLSFRFLPGTQAASIAEPFNQDEVHITFHHHPLATRFKQEIIEHANQAGAGFAYGATVRVRTEHHFPGAMFDVNHPILQQFIDLHSRVLGKEPYMDWHVHPSMASMVYNHHPGAAAMVLGPGEPYLVDDTQEVVQAADITNFQALLDATGDELLYRT